MSEEINNVNVSENFEKSPRKSLLSKFALSTKDNVFVILLLLSSVLTSVFGIFGGFRGGFTVTAVILTAVMSIYLFGKGYKFKLFPTLCLLLSLGVSLVFSITSNGSVRFWSFLCFYLLTMTWFTSIVRAETNRGNIGFFCYLFSPAIESLVNAPASLISIFSKKTASNKTFGKILLGILLSLPVMLIVIPLLMNSDAAFSGMVGVIFKESRVIIFRSIFGLFIGLFIISFAFSVKKDNPLITKTFDLSGMSPTILISFLSVLSLCYLSYLFSQLAYFFNAFSGFLPEGYEFTYANYARRGFFEMCVIAGINFGIIFLCRLFTKKDSKKPLIAVNALSTFIGVFTLLIIATALSKMFLYIKSFGMTKLRITTSAFMIFLAVVFIALMLRLYIKRINIIKTAFVTAAVTLILLGTVNVNSLVAKYNYNAYKTNALNEIDVDTIAELGDEGIPYLIMLTEDDDYDLSNYATYKLSIAYSDYYTFDYDEYGNCVIDNRIYDEIGQLGISRQRAYNELEKYLEDSPFVLNYKNIYTPDDDFEKGIW